MSDVSKSAIGERFDADFETAIANAASAEEIKKLMTEKALATLPRVIHRDYYDPSVIVVDEKELAKVVPQQRLAKTITVNGNSYTVEGSTELELAQSESRLFKELLSPEATQRTEQSRDSQTGRYVPAEPAQTPEEIARVAELRMAMVRGDLSPEEFLVQSGSYERYSQRRENEKVFTGWKSATDEFLHSTEGADWPGGQDMLNRMGEKLLSLGYDGNPSAESLVRAWEIIKAEDYETEIGKKASEARNPYELKNALQPGSSLFGR
jgi:hypothetical protein